MEIFRKKKFFFQFSFFMIEREWRGVGGGLLLHSMALPVKVMVKVIGYSAFPCVNAWETNTFWRPQFAA